MSSIIPASFVGGTTGNWKVTQQFTFRGEPLAFAGFVDIRPEHLPKEQDLQAAWVLRGTNNHTRYTVRTELEELTQRKPALGRPESTVAVLIPITKSEAWWSMAQDERRRVFEEESRHISMSMEYLPAIARRLYHSRDLGEPFDFLTWFEFAPEHERLFQDLLAKLRATREWEFVEREVEVWLVKEK